MPTLTEWLRDQHQNGTPEQQEIARRYVEIAPLARADPRQYLARLVDCRAVAERSQEPWWTLFLDYSRIQILAAELRELDTALELAVRSTVELRKERYQGFALRLLMRMMLLQMYVRQDPFGYEAEIRQAIGALQAEAGPDTEYHLSLQALTAGLETSLGNYDVALDTWQQTVANADAAHTTGFQAISWLNLCYTLQEATQEPDAASYRDILGWSEGAERLIRQEEQRGRAKPRWLSHAIMWQAVALCGLGRINEAKRRYQNAITISRRVADLPMYYQAAKEYYELNDEWDNACAVTARFAQSLAGKGDHWTEARCLWQYCRLRRLMGVRDPADVERAMAVTRKFKQPARAVRVFTRDASLFADIDERNG